jgi:hypothetical protein
MTVALLPFHPAPGLDVLELEPTSALSERDLVGGYAGAAVVQVCLCGGSIAARDNARSIAEAVRRHNATASHEAWAIATGWR